ncbi:hypothetical protein MYX04_15205, partial [Nitrospiraceae bacterium AH_259_D15_M11_P09]|nr:hypothetical protein [Nitrospiraceae bacterium AH_259_D15_M11_P09]
RDDPREDRSRPAETPGSSSAQRSDLFLATVQQDRARLFQPPEDDITASDGRGQAKLATTYGHMGCNAPVLGDQASDTLGEDPVEAGRVRSSR